MPRLTGPDKASTGQLKLGCPVYQVNPTAPYMLDGEEEANMMDTHENQQTHMQSLYAYVLICIYIYKYTYTYTRIYICALHVA